MTLLTMRFGRLSAGHNTVTQLYDFWHSYDGFYLVELRLKAFVRKQDEKLENEWKKSVTIPVKKYLHCWWSCFLLVFTVNGN